jgi:hypothetical protein
MLSTKAMPGQSSNVSGGFWDRYAASLQSKKGAPTLSSHPGYPASTPSTRTTPLAIRDSRRSARPISARMLCASEPGLGAGLPMCTGVRDNLGAGPQVVTRPMSSCSRVALNWCSTTHRSCMSSGRSRIQRCAPRPVFLSGTLGVSLKLEQLTELVSNLFLD